MKTAQLVIIMLLMNLVLNFAAIQDTNITDNEIQTGINKTFTAGGFSGEQITSQVNQGQDSIWRQQKEQLPEDAGFVEAMIKAISILGTIANILLMAFIPPIGILLGATATTAMNSTIESFGIAFIGIIVLMMNITVWVHIVDKVFAKKQG